MKKGILFVILALSLGCTATIEKDDPLTPTTTCEVEKTGVLMVFNFTNQTLLELRTDDKDSTLLHRFIEPKLAAGFNVKSSNIYVKAKFKDGTEKRGSTWVPVCGRGSIEFK